MGEAEIHSNGLLIIRSHIITYGNAADEIVTERIRGEIETMWNEPGGIVKLSAGLFKVIFRITSEVKKNMTEQEVLENTDPIHNYFRIEEFVKGNISFVDGLGCNTGFFKLENLYEGSTTAAHEYGHTLGLHHPLDLDYRSRGIPSIMYPRGTLVDPQFQYDPAVPAGMTGGTMHPGRRKVFQQDVEQLKLHKLRFSNKRALVGDFTNIYHWAHEPGTE